jgi:hypothetical protein|tara:strand:- start:147 stop:380 length:234 start_codon:yes stop_codon:yes gene_type:complete
MSKEKTKKPEEMAGLSDEALEGVAGGANSRKVTDKNSTTKDRYFARSSGVPFQLDEPSDFTWPEEKTRRKRKTLLKE